MMNKAEFEARVRELALAKTERIKKRNRIIKTATTIAGVVATAACIVLVMTRMDTVVKESASGSMSGGAMNNMGGDKNSPEHEEMNNKFECEDMTQADGKEPVNGMDGIYDEVGEEAMKPTESVFFLFSEVNSTPETVVLTTYPDSDDEGQNLSPESIDLVMDWIRNLDLTDTGSKDNDKNGLLYKLELSYPEMVRDLYVFDNMIKVDNGTWYEFTEADEKEFGKLIQNIRE